MCDWTFWEIFILGLFLAVFVIPVGLMIFLLMVGAIIGWVESPANWYRRAKKRWG